MKQKVKTSQIISQNETIIIVTVDVIIDSIIIIVIKVTKNQLEVPGGVIGDQIGGAIGANPAGIMLPRALVIKVKSKLN